MQFDPENNIVKLCALGMQNEREGDVKEAAKLFQQAWAEATTDVEKFIAAHYIARHQNSVADKLKWDKTALGHALKVNTDDIKSVYPSLYLNIAKCYEDMNNPDRASESYQSAYSFVSFLPNDDYGKMIKLGIDTGIMRVKSL